MKTSEIRARSTTDLREEATAKETEIQNLRFRAGSEKAADPSHMRELRRDVARIKTILRERELDVRGQSGDVESGRSRKADA
ncbi:MAG: 50S ribosomal protein L29 [Planctomycetota bacterium]|jgi:large subunit ribosomal protein L29